MHCGSLTSEIGIPAQNDRNDVPFHTFHLLGLKFRAPKIHYSGDNVMNLEEEIERGEELICSRCGIKGAVLGCFYGPCRKSYHATCALEIDCSWDSVSFLFFFSAVVNHVGF